MTNHRSLRSIFVLLVILFIALAGASNVGAQDNPPGNDGDLCHGANQESCRPDPNPNGQDCEDHGNNVDGNDDHCASEAPTSTPDPTLSPSPTSEPSEPPTPSESPSVTPSPSQPAPSPSISPSESPTAGIDETPLTSSSPTLKPSSKPTPRQPVATAPPTDTEPDSTAASSVNLSTLLPLVAGAFIFLMLVVEVRKPRRR